MEVNVPSSVSTTKKTADIWSDRTKIAQLIFVNVLTIIRAFLLIPSIVWLLNDRYLESFVCALVAANLDWLDGFLARRWGVVTDFGKFADPMADKMYFLGMLVALYAHIHIVVIAVICGLEMSLVAHRVFVLVRKLHADVSSNFFGKFKAVLQNIVICVLLLGLFVGKYDTNIAKIIVEYIALPLLYCTVPWATLSLLAHVRKHR